MSTLLDRLGRLDTCAVSDAKGSLGLSAAVSGVGRASGQGGLAGWVTTVQLAAGKPAPDAPKVNLGARAIVAATDETGIVVAHPGIDAGGCGGVLSTSAQLAGVRGVIIDGPTRARRRWSLPCALAIRSRRCWAQPMKPCWRPSRERCQCNSRRQTGLRLGNQPELDGQGYGAHASPPIGTNFRSQIAQDRCSNVGRSVPAKSVA